ncbi:MAG: hypothetical protein ACRDUX_00760 [Mycobacterium sp.]
MANPFDVASRLAEGNPAVDDVEEYVTACRRLGYQHPDLTASATQVRDWYASEDGLDLRALDGDCAALSAVASAAEDAARTQADLVAELSAAWSGRGAAAAREFTWRSGQAASAVSAAVRASADAAATLRDELWRAVDAKVAAVQAIDGRHQAQRTQWLAAAKTMTSGAGDLAAASELIDQEVKPFVDNDIGSDWLTAMRAAGASINGAYDAALATMTAAPRAVFEVPGELGPRAQTPEPVAAPGDAPLPSSSSSVQTVPAAAGAPAPVPAASSPMSSSAAPWAAPAPAMSPALVDPAGQAPAASMPGATPSMPSLGDLGAGTSSLGSGLSGFGQQLADLIGGLVGSTDDGLPDSADVDELDEVDGPEEPLTDEDEPDDPDPSDDETEEPPPDQDPVAEEVVESGEATVGCGEPADGPALDPAPAPTVVEPPLDSPPSPQPMPQAVADTGEPTPCEIAADELPQVGE